MFARGELARRDLAEGVAEGGAEGVKRRCWTSRRRDARISRTPAKPRQRRQPGAPGYAFAEHRGWSSATS